MESTMRAVPRKQYWLGKEEERGLKRTGDSAMVATLSDRQIAHCSSEAESLRLWYGCCQYIIN